VGNQKNPPTPQANSSPKVVRTKVDDDSLRVRLLTSETVQKDLGLTADQLGMLKDCAKTSKELDQEFRAKSREILPRNQQFTQDEFEAREQKYHKWMEDLKSRGKQLQTKILAMLTPSQSERLKQIQLQTQIAAVLDRTEIIKALDISQDQSEKIRELRDRLDEKLSAKMQTALASPDKKERLEKLIQFKKESDRATADASKQILNALTPEQRAKFETMQGKKIEVTWHYDSMTLEDVEF
jgi:hypothetical protein